MCTMKTMLKIMLGLGILLIAGYVAFPEYRQAIAALSPYLLLLGCPIGMYFMMDSMKTPPQDKEQRKDQDQK